MLSLYQGKYYVNDIDYNDLASQHVPVAILSGHYKIDTKIHHKNDIVMSTLVFLTVNQTDSKTE